jgi:hypothetical protein
MDSVSISGVLSDGWANSPGWQEPATADHSAVLKHVMLGDPT